MQISNDEAKQRIKQILNSRRRKRPDDDPTPISARDLADRAGIGIGKAHEYKRRKIRELMAEIRKDGFPVAFNFKGYWIAETAEDHKQHQDQLRKMGLTHLAAAAQDKQSQAQADADGQLDLFPDSAPSRVHI